MIEFKLDEFGNLIGYGIVIPPVEQLAPGVIALDLATLNRLVRVVELYYRCNQPTTQVERDKARIRAAQEDLLEDLGLDSRILDEAKP